MEIVVGVTDWSSSTTKLRLRKIGRRLRLRLLTGAASPQVGWRRNMKEAD